MNYVTQKYNFLQFFPNSGKVPERKDFHCKTENFFPVTGGNTQVVINTIFVN